MTDQPAKDRPLTTEERLARINRALPFSDEAEKGVLSCLMQDPERIAEVRAKLPPEAFYHECNRLVFEVMLDMLDKNLPVEPIAITHRLRDQKKLDLIGGGVAVTELYTFVPIPTHYPHYVGILREKWALRQAIDASAQNIDECYAHGSEQSDEDVTAVIGRAEARIFACVQALQASGEYSTGPVLAARGVVDWVDRTQQTIANRGKIMGLETGILELDQTVHASTMRRARLSSLPAVPDRARPRWQRRSFTTSPSSATCPASSSARK